MDESPQLHYVLIPVAMGVFIGFMMGIILVVGANEYSFVGQNKSTVLVATSLSGGFIGWLLSRWFIGQRERWFFYAWDTESSISPKVQEMNDGGVVLSLVIMDNQGNRISKEIHGLTLDEWRQLGIGVVKNGFEFSSRKLQTMFTPASRGATIYEIVRPKLEDRYIGVLIPSGSNAVAVSGDRGERFFEQLAKGDFEILRLLDNPQSPAPQRDMV